MVEKFKQFIRPSERYTMLIGSFYKVDGYKALALSLIVFLSCHVAGRVYYLKQMNVSTLINILLPVLCIYLSKREGRSLEHLGFSMTEAPKAVCLGTVLGLLILVVDNIQNIMYMSQLRNLNQIIGDFVSRFIIISLGEEIVFRGYIQPRLYSIAPNYITAQAIGALLFTMFHLPYRAAVLNMTIFALLGEHGILQMIMVNAILHIVFDFLHRKYNCIWANTLVHGCLAFKNYIFA